MPDGSHDGERNEGDDGGESHVVEPVTVQEHVEELDACVQADAAEEEREAEFAEHEVCAVRHEEVQRANLAFAAEEDGHDQRASGETELQRCRHSGEGERDASDDDSEEDSQERGQYFGVVERGERVA